MTDDHEPQHDPIDDVDELDELLSAHLDAELELLEERPDLDDEIVDARLRELRSVADAVGASVPPVPASIVDDQIAAALQALPTPADAPTSLTAARAAKRRPRLAERIPLLGAAAAVLLVVFGLAVVVSNLDDGAESDDGDADTAEVADATQFRGELDEAESSEEAEVAADAAPAPEATEAPAEEAGDAGDGALADAEEAGGDDTAAADESDTDETEAPSTTAAASGEEGESPVPIELTEVCTGDLLSRLDADELLSSFERLDGTAEVVVSQGGDELTVVIDPGLCNGTVDPVLPDQP